MRHSRRQQNKSAGEDLARTQMLFYFSFCSFRKHRRARSSRKETIFSTPTPTPLRWRWISPPRFLFFYQARSTNFEEKIEGLWTGQRRLSKMGLLSILHLPNPCNTSSQCKYFVFKPFFFLTLCLTNDSVRYWSVEFLRNLYKQVFWSCYYLPLLFTKTYVNVFILCDKSQLY